MTRKTYSLLFPLVISGIVLAGMAAGLLFPAIPNRSYALFAVLLMPVFYLLDRFVLRRRIDEPLTDERIQGLAEHAALVSLRVGTGVLMIAGIVLLLVFPGEGVVGPVGAVVMLAAAFQAIVFTVVYKVREHKSAA